MPDLKGSKTSRNVIDCRWIHFTLRCTTSLFRILFSVKTGKIFIAQLSVSRGKSWKHIHVTNSTVCLWSHLVRLRVNSSPSRLLKSDSSRALFLPILYERFPSHEEKYNFKLKYNIFEGQLEASQLHTAGSPLKKKRSVHLRKFSSFSHPCCKSADSCWTYFSITAKLKWV